MRSNTATHLALHKSASIWEIEISDLGACKPFIGYSLTDQYILLSVTAPDAQNEVAFTSVPEIAPNTVHIPLAFSNFEYPWVGGFQFKGLQKLTGFWNVRLFNVITHTSYHIEEKVIFPVEIEEEVDRSFFGIAPNDRAAAFKALSTFEIVLTAKKSI